MSIDHERQQAQRTLVRLGYDPITLRMRKALLLRVLARDIMSETHSISAYRPFSKEALIALGKLIGAKLSAGAIDRAQDNLGFRIWAQPEGLSRDHNVTAPYNTYLFDDYPIRTLAVSVLQLRTHVLTRRKRHPPPSWKLLNTSDTPIADLNCSRCRGQGSPYVRMDASGGILSQSGRCPACLGTNRHPDAEGPMWPGSSNDLAALEDCQECQGLGIDAGCPFCKGTIPHPSLQNPDGSFA